MEVLYFAKLLPVVLSIVEKLFFPKVFSFLYQFLILPAFKILLTSVSFSFFPFLTLFWVFWMLLASKLVQVF